MVKTVCRIILLILCRLAPAQSPAILVIGESEGTAGETGAQVAVALENSEPAAGVQFTLRDDLNLLRIDTVLTTPRTSGFIARSHRNKVLLYDVSAGIIAPGTGPILHMVVHADPVTADTLCLMNMEPTPLVVLADGNKMSQVFVLQGRFKVYTGTAVHRDGAAIPAQDGLCQNYPNPFNAVTAIHFQLQEAGAVDVAVYDVNARLCRRLVHGKCPAGRYIVNFDATALPSGVYFCTMSAGGFTARRKMMLVK